MAFKYQVLLCPRPKDVLLVTLNHLDAIKGLIQDSPTILHQVDKTFRQLTDIYGGLSAGEFQLIRQTLLIFFQDLHIRVSEWVTRECPALPPSRDRAQVVRADQDWDSAPLAHPRCLLP
ncbi:hypothetical protein E5288_WYG021289 [Bos mutus]|uniref:Uncharacterized protein n=1 Tax=Bos mutus TaxID=72004 RepID=A0A6B0SDH7_9CETA|nr:hypothetical protein [Bos mutus]